MQSLVILIVVVIVIHPICGTYERTRHKETGKALNIFDDDDKIHHGYVKINEKLVAKSVMKEPLYLTSISFINGSYKPVRFARPTDIKPPAKTRADEPGKHEGTLLQASHELESTTAQVQEDISDGSNNSDADVVLDLSPSAPPRKGKQAFYRLATYFLNGTKTEEEVPLDDSGDDDGQ